jgi:hypothetical protein
MVGLLEVSLGADMVQQCPPYSVGGVQGAPELGECLWGASDISRRWDSVQARCVALHRFHSGGTLKLLPFNIIILRQVDKFRAYACEKGYCNILYILSYYRHAMVI